MRILAINQYYLPDHSATSQLLGQLCEGLAAAGESVTVVASRGVYLGGRSLPDRETRAGVEIIRPWATTFGKGSSARRMSDYLSFWASGVAAAASARRPDVILALTTPPMIAAGAALVSGLRRVPLVTWVHDVYPEVAAAFGVLSERSLSYRGLRALAAETHHRTTRIVTLSEGMAARLVGQGAPAERVRVVTNWADGQLIVPIPHAQNSFRTEHDLRDRFVAMYSGNLGEGHDFATFIEAARRLERARPRVLFLFVGSGNRERELRTRAQNLTNVRFLPYQPRERLGQSLPSADVHLISLRPGLEGLLVPSKLYGALACGRPIFFVGPELCEVARMVSRYDLGWHGRAGDSRGLANALIYLHDHPEHWTRLVERARDVFMREHDLPIALAQWRSVLQDARRSGQWRGCANL